MYTDASGGAVAGVLMQLVDGKVWKPIAYTSKALDDVQSRWHSSALETYAAVYALKQWRLYLVPQQFEIWTDNTVLQSLLTKSENLLTKQEARWITFLGEFNFDIRHVKGSENFADGLSRRPDYMPSNMDQPVSAMVQVELGVDDEVQTFT